MISSINSHNMSFTGGKSKAAEFALNLCGGKNRIITVSDKAEKAFTWMGQHLSSPENRLILGATALATQPFIDACNKNVDEKTRKISICRTVAKILACTTTGVIIRRASIKAIDAFTVPNGTSKLSKLLLPTIETVAENMKTYKDTWGTLLGLGIMLFTNFLVDAPLTKWLTNKFVKMKGLDDEHK